MKKCDLCHKPGKTHYRVKSIIHTKWIFSCKECWNLISTHKNYRTQQYHCFASEFVECKSIMT